VLTVSMAGLDDGWTWWSTRMCFGRYSSAPRSGLSLARRFAVGAPLGYDGVEAVVDSSDGSSTQPSERAERDGERKRENILVQHSTPTMDKFTALLAL
jgi:hypothetical protein